MTAHYVRLIDAARAVIASVAAAELLPETVLDALSDAHHSLTLARRELLRRCDP